MAGATAAVRPSGEVQGGCLAGCELRALEQTAVSSVVLGSGGLKSSVYVCMCVWSKLLLSQDRIKCSD